MFTLNIHAIFHERHQFVGLCCDVTMDCAVSLVIHCYLYFIEKISVFCTLLGVNKLRCLFSKKQQNNESCGINYIQDTNLMISIITAYSIELLVENNIFICYYNFLSYLRPAK